MNKHVVYARGVWPSLDGVPVRGDGSDPVTEERERWIACLEDQRDKWRELAEKLLDDREAKP
jgi:hypothetical protein